MKKLLQKIKLRKCKTEVDTEGLDVIKENVFIVCFMDGTWEKVFFKDDLLYILRQDHIKPVHYVFGFLDRIIVDRDILIDEVIE